MRIAFAARLVGLDGHVALGQAGRNFEPAHHRLGKFKRAIFHQLGIQPAVGAKIDVFKKRAPHRRIDRGPGLSACTGNRHRLSGRA